MSESFLFVPVIFTPRGKNCFWDENEYDNTNEVANFNYCIYLAQTLNGEIEKKSEAQIFFSSGRLQSAKVQAPPVSLS